MKVLVIFGLLVAYTQATSEPISVQARISQAQSECIEENDWNVNEINAISKNTVLPTANSRFNEFEYCYWKKVGAVTDGTINVSLLKVILRPLVQAKYPNTSDDEAAQVIDEAVVKCMNEKPTEVESLGQDYVILHNCISQYVREKRE